MAALLVDRLHCLQDTPEWTADEVYLFVACGRVGARGQLRVLTLAAADWKGLVAGTRADADLVIDADYAPDKVYIGLLLEQDGQRDLAQDEVRRSLENELGEILQMFASIRGTTAAEVAEELRRAVDLCVETLRGNDQPIGRATILDFAAGAGSASFLFQASQTRYRLDLKIS